MRPPKNTRNQIREKEIKRINKTLWKFKIHHLLEIERVINAFYKDVGGKGRKNNV